MKPLAAIIVTLILMAGTASTNMAATPTPTATLLKPTATPTNEFISAYAAILAKGADYQGTTTEGYYYLGNPDAPVLLEEFASFSCPHCESFLTEVVHHIQDKIEAGLVKFVYIPVTNFGPFDSTTMTRAVMCAGEQGKFWQMHDLMFEWLNRFGSSAGQWQNVRKAADLIDLDIQQLRTCYEDADFSAVFDAASEQVKLRGVLGVPAVYFNGMLLESAHGGPVGLIGLRDAIDDFVERSTLTPTPSPTQ
ncbi:MAG: thioredoxin domain-containing protein [Anaerolineae bacterium]|nr:thioredoxin domain-containing protein [Anaerolineae bacterium]